MTKTIIRIFFFVLYCQSAVFAADWSDKGYFRENQGQLVDQNNKVNSEVLFLMEQSSMKIYLTNKGFSYEIYKCINCDDYLPQKNSDCEVANRKFQFNSYRVDITFLNSNKDFSIEKYGEINSNDIYYNQTFTNKEKEYIASKRVVKVVYKNIYPGIDIQFLTNNNGEFKYDLLLQNGADLSQINLAFNGSTVQLDKNGAILINTPLGDILETIPTSFTTDIDGKRKEVDVHFNIKGENTVSFSSLTNLNGKQLLIDPFPAIQWATYYGDTNIDLINAITSDKQGNIIVVGQTLSSNNIATTGSHQSTYDADFDVFVTKFNKNGVRQWSTYYGGNSTDRGTSICTDLLDNIYIGGSTFSSFNIASIGAMQPVIESTDDAFLVKFNASGVRQWGTYYGGNQHDYIADMTVDSDDNVIVTGHTRSSYNISTIGTHQPNLVGLENAFISKFSTAGSLLWGTYLGAGGYDSGYGIEVDNANNIFVGGHTQSTSNIATIGTFQTTFQGVVDGFIVKFNSNGVRSWGTYFGGSSLDRIWDIALDSNNNIFVVGDTESNDTIATVGAFQVIKGSFDESFLQKFDNNGQRLWGTFIGGNTSDYLYSVKCIKQTGDVVVGGYTESDTNISSPDVFQPQRGGAYDGFVMKFNNNGNRYWGTYFGGPASEEMKTMTISENNNIVIGGYTGSTSGIATSGAHQTLYGGHIYDGFIVKLCEPLIPTILFTDSVCEGNQIILTTNTGFLTFLWNDSTTLQQHESFPTAAGVYSYWVTTIDTNICPNTSDTVNITVLPIPPIPTITQNDTVLTSSISSSYQWYLDENLIFGETNQNITILNSGSYTVIVSDVNGCYAESDPFIVTNINLITYSPKINLYPNPADKLLHIVFDNKNLTKNISYTIFNALGEKIISEKSSSNDTQHIIPVDDLSSGIYGLNISGEDCYFKLTFVVQH
jgi:hypothetical protein